jgi:hypothetical protein
LRESSPFLISRLIARAVCLFIIFYYASSANFLASASSGFSYGLTSAIIDSNPLGFSTS